MMLPDDVFVIPNEPLPIVSRDKFKFPEFVKELVPFMTKVPEWVPEFLKVLELLRVIVFDDVPAFKNELELLTITGLEIVPPDLMSKIPFVKVKVPVPAYCPPAKTINEPSFTIDLLPPSILPKTSIL